MTTSCPEELLGLRRVGQLDAARARVLDEHLQSCTDCVLDESLHESCEKDGSAQILDDQLIARAVDATLLQRRSRRARRSWFLAVGISAALIMAAGLASAAAWLYGRATTRPVAQSVAAPVLRSVLPAAPTPSAMPELAPPESVPVEQAAPPPARPRTHRRPLALAEAPVAPALDVRALFAAANEARRAGELNRAGELYAELQRRFPESREAQLSLVSFGRILLDRGRAGEALAQFERHLRSSPGGVLAAEALYGQARALTHLHRQAEARRCWGDLLARFPDSIYADVARSQLGAKP